MNETIRILADAYMRGEIARDYFSEGMIDDAANALLCRILNDEDITEDDFVDIKYNARLAGFFAGVQVMMTLLCR